MEVTGWKQEVSTPNFSLMVVLSLSTGIIYERGFQPVETYHGIMLLITFPTKTITSAGWIAKEMLN